MQPCRQMEDSCKCFYRFCILAMTSTIKCFRCQPQPLSQTPAMKQPDTETMVSEVQHPQSAPRDPLISKMHYLPSRLSMSGDFGVFSSLIEPMLTSEPTDFPGTETGDSSTVSAICSFGASTIGCSADGSAGRCGLLFKPSSGQPVALFEGRTSLLPLTFLPFFTTCRIPVTRKPYRVLQCLFIPSCN